MKKLFGILIIVLFVFTLMPALTGTVHAFEPGGQIRIEVGMDVGTDIMMARTADTQITTEIRLDPHQLLRIEATGTTGWTDGVHSNTFEVEEVGFLVMPVRGGSFWFVESADVGCGAKTGGLIDGNTRLSFEPSNRYWLGCLAEITF